jgi:hypothetical protein
MPTIEETVAILEGKRKMLLAAMIAADKGTNEPRGYQAQGKTRKDSMVNGPAWIQGHVDADFLLPTLKFWFDRLRYLGITKLPPWTGEPNDETKTLELLDGLIAACREALPTANEQEREEFATPPPEAKDNTVQTVTRPGDRAAASGADTNGWYTVTQAARIATCNSGVISNAVKAGKLKSNGKDGHSRRVDGADLSRWQLERATRPESTESEDAVQKKMDNAAKKPRRSNR